VRFDFLIATTVKLTLSVFKDSDLSNTTVWKGAREFWCGNRKVTLRLVVGKWVVRMRVGSDAMESLCISCVELPLSGNTVLDVVKTR